MTSVLNPAFAHDDNSAPTDVAISQITFKQLPEQLRQAAQAISRMLRENGQELDAPIRTTLGNAETDLHIGMPVVPGSEDNIRQLAHTLVGYVHDAAPAGLREATTPVFLRFVSRDVTGHIADILPVDGVSQAIVVPVTGRDSLHAALREASIGDALEKSLRNFNDHFVLIADFSAAPEAFDALEDFKNLQKPLNDDQVKAYLATLGNIKAINEAMAAANNSFEATSALTGLVNSIGRMAQKLSSYQASQVKDGKDADVTSLSSVRQSTAIRQDALQVEAQLRAQISNPSLSESARAGLRVALQQMQQQRLEAIGAKPRPTLTPRMAQNDNSAKPVVKTAADNKAKAQAGTAIPVKETPKSGATTVEAKAQVSAGIGGKEPTKTNGPTAAATAAENKAGPQVSSAATATKDALKIGVTETKATSTGSALGNAAGAGATIAAPANVNPVLGNKPAVSALGKETVKTAIEGKATALSATVAVTGLAATKETTKTSVAADGKVTVPITAAIGAKETAKSTAAVDAKTTPASDAAIVSKEASKAGVTATTNAPVTTSTVTTSAETIVNASVAAPTAATAVANPVSALKAATGATLQVVSTDAVVAKASQAAATTTTAMPNGVASVSASAATAKSATTSMPSTLAEAVIAKSTVTGASPVATNVTAATQSAVQTAAPPFSSIITPSKSATISAATPASTELITAKTMVGNTGTGTPTTGVPSILPNNTPTQIQSNTPTKPTNVQSLPEGPVTRTPAGGGITPNPVNVTPDSASAIPPKVSANGAASGETGALPKTGSTEPTLRKDAPTIGMPPNANPDTSVAGKPIAQPDAPSHAPAADIKKSNLSVPPEDKLPKDNVIDLFKKADPGRSPDAVPITSAPPPQPVEPKLPSLPIPAVERIDLKQPLARPEPSPQQREQLPQQRNENPLTPDVTKKEFVDASQRQNLPESEIKNPVIDNPKPVADFMDMSYGEKVQWFDDSIKAVNSDIAELKEMHGKGYKQTQEYKALVEKRQNLIDQKLEELPPPPPPPPKKDCNMACGSCPTPC